jgi:hypothetical protein
VREHENAVVRIFDLLSEKEYQESIEWRHLYRLADVFHRVFPGRADIDAVPDTGLLVEAIVRGATLSADVELRREYRIGDLLLKPTMGLQANTIAFERPLGAYDA